MLMLIQDKNQVRFYTWLSNTYSRFWICDFGLAGTGSNTHSRFWICDFGLTVTRLARVLACLFVALL
ncbi:MAG: hypothetical protein ACFE0I_06665 [Elainellaceae cyanobacterium]